MVQPTGVVVVQPTEWCAIGQILHGLEARYAANLDPCVTLVCRIYVWGMAFFYVYLFKCRSKPKKKIIYNRLPNYICLSMPIGYRPLPGTMSL